MTFQRPQKIRFMRDMIKIIAHGIKETGVPQIQHWVRYGKQNEFAGF